MPFTIHEAHDGQVAYRAYFTLDVGSPGEEGYRGEILPGYYQSEFCKTEDEAAEEMQKIADGIKPDNEDIYYGHVLKGRFELEDKSDLNFIEDDNFESKHKIVVHEEGNPDVE